MLAFDTMYAPSPRNVSGLRGCVGRLYSAATILRSIRAVYCVLYLCVRVCGGGVSSRVERAKLSLADARIAASFEILGMCCCCCVFSSHGILYIKFNYSREHFDLLNTIKKSFVMKYSD